MVGWLWRIIELIFPPNCVGCGSAGAWWCDHCDAQVKQIATPRCSGCGKLTAKGQYCPRCRRKTVLTGLIAGAYYQPPFNRAVQALKYRHAWAVAPRLVVYLLPPSAQAGLSATVLVVPVPLHAARQRQRGHNQAEVLARLVVKATGWQITTDLERTKHTTSQTGLTRAQRQTNVRDAFRWRGPPLQNRTVLLIDDVATTRSTLNACAAALKAAGARQVWAGVIAKR